MTLQIFPGERLFKFIEAKTFDSQRKKFLSKIDKDGKVTVYTYTYDLKDTTQEGKILKKHNAAIVNMKSKDLFQSMISVNMCVYPGFEILFERDYSDMPVGEALREFVKEDLGVIIGKEKDFDNIGDVDNKNIELIKEKKKKRRRQDESR